MEIIKISDINEARKKIQALKRTNPLVKIAVYSQDDEFNRKVIEIKGLNAIIINEEINIKDYTKQRNSGLNEVLCKLATKNNIAIGIDIKGIKEKSEIEKAKALARLKQNLMLAKKAKTQIFLIKNNSEKKIDLASILLILGASTQQTKDIVNFGFNSN